MKAALEQQVRRRARGRCEYCRMPFAYLATKEIDHVIARQHGGKATLDNLAVACSHCNAFKGPNVAGVDPETGKIVRLYNPRQDRWHRHFRYEGGTLHGLTSEGRATVRTLFHERPARGRCAQGSD
jgi:hypothetical protein